MKGDELARIVSCYDDAPPEYDFAGTMPLSILRDAVAQIHPHTTCPYCGPNAYGAKCADAVTDDELVKWWVDNRWRQSAQEVVARLRRDFNVTRKEKP